LLRVRSLPRVYRSAAVFRRWAARWLLATLTVLGTMLPAGAHAGGWCRVTQVKVQSASPDDAGVTDRGKRLVIDLRGAVVDGATAALSEPRGPVGGVMTQDFAVQGNRVTRVLIQLTHQAGYRIHAAPDGLRIVLRAADKTAQLPDSPTDVPSAVGAASAPSSPDASRLLDVRFEPSAGTHRVVLQFDRIPSYQLSTRAPGRSVLELRDVELPDALVRKLDVGAYGGPVRAVSTYRDGSRPGQVWIDVDHAAAAKPVVTRYGTALHYLFGTDRPHSMLTGIGPDGGAARRTKTVGMADAAGLSARGLDALNAAAADGDGAEWSTLPERAGAFLPVTVPEQQRRRYTGRRIDLDLKDADIHNVLRLIADVGGVNIVTADNVSGQVTIRMRNVPWDQALDTVLQAKGFGMVRQGTIIRVAPQADLNKEQELAIAKRKSELELAPIETRLIPVSYAKAQELQARAKDMLSPRGSIAVDERTNVLIARDVAGNLNQVEELVRALDTQTPQVLIEARIVEATSRFQRDVGIQWGGDLTFGPATGNETGLVFPSSIGLAGGASDGQTPTAGLSPVANSVPNPNFAINLPAAVGTGAGGAIGLNFGSIDNTVNLAVRLSAAEASGMLRIVSSPRILTLDNSEARISQGTLIPFSQVSAQGVQTVFQEAKLQLLVQPHVTADGSVSMRVKINRDEPDFNQTSARGDPTILKREAETDLLVPDGHTAVIGGIYSRNTGRNIDQVPLLGDIPILGVLFQRRRASDIRTELVIFITPRIVNRATALGK
jgi:type IV pilus assembly protein PilQ